jgi:hypothetical protein
MPPREGDFAVPVADGQWAGFLTEIEDRGRAVRILVVRTFLPPPMTARKATIPDAALLALSGAGDAP